MVIYGWGRQTLKDEGGVLPAKCPNCNNLVEWRLVRRRVWFTLYFIPIFPYTNQHWLVCPVCNMGFKLSKEGAAQARAPLSRQDSVGDKTEYPQPPEAVKPEANKPRLPNLRLLYSDSDLKYQQEILSCTTCAFCDQEAAKQGQPWCSAPNSPHIENNYCNTFTPKNKKRV